MQVADIQGDATSATLGAQKTTAMGMVQDAAFLMMLSTNLYSNQKLACIRETLCNAWDAHIEAKRTDVPVKVTITDDNELIIEDSGFGIPKDMFEQIYGTFGGSTKRTNTAVTGGFGLGCKSPWAYTESFRVISESQGLKVVYNLVKASVEADGMPAITKVMEMPTERSGLTVRFQLQAADVEQITEYIRAVAMHGDMTVLFSRQGVVSELTKINMSSEVGSYNIENHWFFAYMGRSSIFVRYGAVLYPILEVPATKKAVDLLKQFMEMVGFKRMVVQAAPGTLALTPNREALSSSKMTEDGITDLCVALVARIEDDLIKQIPGSIMEAVKRLESLDRYQTSLDVRAPLINAIMPYTVQRYLNSSLGKPKFLKYEPMLKAAEHRGFKISHTFTNRAATREYHKLRVRLSKVHDWKKMAGIKYGFLNHYVLRPLSRVFQKHPKLLSMKQFAHVEHYTRHTTSERKMRLFYNIDASAFDEIQQLIDTPFVFITSRAKKVYESIKCCPDIEHPKASWVYKIEPRDKNKDAIIKAFSDAGYKVVDLTLNHDWDDPAAEMEAERARRYASKVAKTGTLPGVESKQRKNLMMSLSNAYKDSGVRKMDRDHIKAVKVADETTDTPLFYVPVDDIYSSGQIGMFGYYMDLTEEERKHGVIVRTGVEKNMAIKRGAIDSDTYLARKLWERAHSPEYKEYCTKFRKDSLFDQFFIQEDHIELLEYLGIKLPGLDKLIKDSTMERTLNRVKEVSWSHFRIKLSISADEAEEYCKSILKYKLEETPAITKLLMLKNDRMINCFFQVFGLLELAKEFPERKAALKSLVMSAFKSGKTNE